MTVAIALVSVVEKNMAASRHLSFYLPIQKKGNQIKQTGVILFLSFTELFQMISLHVAIHHWLF